MQANEDISDDHTSAVMPLFLDNGRKLEQFASGVAITLNGTVFILTAAHVTDLAAQGGSLCAPTRNGLLPICGSYAHTLLPRDIPRNKDKYDVAYFRLTSEFAVSLHQAIRPLTLKDCRLRESLVENDVYTFSGYPTSKAKARGEVHFSEAFSYTGTAASISKYRRMNYDPSDHILVNFNRKKSIKGGGVQLTPPHPRGISGGGVFAWPKDVFERMQPDFPRFLVGIGHTYEKRSSCLIGTRINQLLALIVANHIDIAKETASEESETATPMFLTMVWYRQEEWHLLMADFDDADKYHKTWNQWRQAFENGLEHLGRDGMLPTPVEITREEILEYCQQQRQPNTSQTRLTLANTKFMRMIRERQL